MAKIVLIGPPAGGKTALSIRLVRDEFVENHIQLKGCQFLRKEIKDIEHENIVLDFWDVEFKVETMKVFLQNADFILCVFSLKDRNSFNALKTKILFNEALNPKESLNKPPYLLIGTHADKPSDVSMQELNELTNEFSGMKYFPVSSCNGRGIEALSFYLNDNILELLKTKAFKRNLLDSDVFYSKATRTSKRIEQARQECGHLWNNSITPIQNIRNILHDYAQNNNGFSLWYLLHANRRNTWQVDQIVQQINLDKFSNALDIVKKIDAINDKNPDGALSLRLTFIKFKLGIDENINLDEEEIEAEPENTKFCGLF